MVSPTLALTLTTKLTHAPLGSLKDEVTLLVIAAALTVDPRAAALSAARVVAHSALGAQVGYVCVIVGSAVAASPEAHAEMGTGCVCFGFCRLLELGIGAELALSGLVAG